MAGKTHAAAKRKRVKFKAKHPEGRKKFAEVVKAAKKIVKDFMDLEKRAEFMLKKKVEKANRKREEKEREERKLAMDAALKENIY